MAKIWCLVSPPRRSQVGQPFVEVTSNLFCLSGLWNVWKSERKLREDPEMNHGAIVLVRLLSIEKIQQNTLVHQQRIQNCLD